MVSGGLLCGDYGDDDPISDETMVLLLQLHAELFPASQHRFLFALQQTILVEELRIGSVGRISELLLQGA